MHDIDIVIGLPSRNEEDSISNVTKIVDRALVRHYPNLKAIIYNIDSNSEDGTRTAFEGVQTDSPKMSFNTEKIGKGHNLLHLFTFALEQQIPYICTFDTDLTSISEDWVKKVLDPLLSQEADYIVPVYSRNKYEANTTNHFCYPILAAHFNTPVRQPYAGDFGLNLKVVQYLMTQSIFEPIYHYGIDIWMTTHAVGGSFTLKEVYLGKKIHKPGFPKMVPMFGQAAATMFKIVRQYRDFSSDGHNLLMEKAEYRQGIDDFVRKPSDKEIADRLETALTFVHERLDRNSPFDHLLVDLKSEFSTQNHISAEKWSYYLREALTIVKNNEFDNSEFINLGLDFTPFYLLRVLSYFKEIESIGGVDVDNIINLEVTHLKQLLNG